MAKGKEFENILNECLDRLIAGVTVESCLARYQEYAAELEPLLKTALEARTAASVKPRPEFRQRAGLEFQKAIGEMPLKQPRTGFRWQLRWALPVALVVVILTGGTGTVYAATNALPDSPLYSVKLATEQVQLAFTFSDQGKADLYARFADYRVEEIVKMAEKGDYESVEKATEYMNNQLAAIADLEFNGKGKEDTFSAMMTTQTTTATRYPMTTTTTVPVLAPAPTTIAPPPAVTETQPPSDAAAVAASPEQAGKKPDDAGLPTDKEKLKERLTKEFERNLKKLEDQLAKAPESLKPALLKAIETLRQGYEEAIASLE